MAVFSAVNPSGASVRFMMKQLMAIGVGGFFIFILSSLNYQIFRAYPWVIYAFTVLALIAVLRDRAPHSRRQKLDRPGALLH